MLLSFLVIILYCQFDKLRANNLLSIDEGAEIFKFNVKIFPHLFGKILAKLERVSALPVRRLTCQIFL